MNFSAISKGSIIGRALRAPLNLIPPKTAMPVLQGRLKGKRWLVGSSNHGCWLGSYEYEKRRLFEKTVTPGSVVYDIGAHVGFYTLLASVLVGSSGRVFAFEPLPSNLAYLQAHLRLNRISNAAVIAAAVCDLEGTSLFEEGESSSMGHLAPEGNLQVATVTLDALFSRGEIPAPDFIKIDVEGAEVRVLSGAPRTLAQRHPALFIATHGRDLHRECSRILNSLGYRILGVGERPPDQTDELFACT